MSRMSAPFVCLLVLATACGGGDGNSGDSNTSSQVASGEVQSKAGNRSPPGRTASGLVEGKDYVVLERVRFNDEEGFDRPVEAVSILAPRGWQTEGGIRWNWGCRGDLASWQYSVTSPDGAIQFKLLPSRTFGFFQDQMLQQAALQAAQRGDCEVSQPFTAAQYLEQFARTELGGASVSNVRHDEKNQAVLDEINANGNAVSRQYGTNSNHTGSAVYGTLNWPDGTKGLAQVGVMVIMTHSADLNGIPNGSASTSVFLRAFIRYPPEREAEALKLWGTIGSSQRVNPTWKQAKEAFLTQLGNREHAGRMERLRLQGEQSAAYARAQSDASDARMRNWERAQASSDASQRRFIQTIREVETWKDSSGTPVELNAGYSHGWSRPDGSYILTNNSNFDPAVELQQNWERMQKPPR